MKLLGTFHMKKRVYLNWMVLLPLALSLLFGCGGKGKEVKKIEGEPEILYKGALARFNKRDYSEALKKFEELKSSFPDSPPYTVWAELKIGDCHFFKKEYVEAIAAYEEFKKIHPSHEEIPYVQFQIGMSYYNQMHTLDRDQTPTKKALSDFEYLIANFPPSLFTEKAKEKIGLCKKRMADHEFYIGNFYYKQGKFQAAIWRFEGLLEKFPKDPKEDKILYLLGKSYFELEQWEKAELVFTKIITEYPESSYSKEARAILEKDLTEKKVSLHKTKESKKKGEVLGVESENIPLVKFEEEGREPISLKEEKKVGIPPSVEAKKVEPLPAEELTPSPDQKATKTKVEPIEEKRTPALPSPQTPSKEKEKVNPSTPRPEDRGLPSTRAQAEGLRVNPERHLFTPPSKAGPGAAEWVKKGIPLETKEAKLVDNSQPIDITSDKVEAYRKDNLIIFQGNVIARQKDIVIYADSLEAVIIEDGKGIERVTAGGDVKIQQGLRVANCQKAVFYNLDQKIVLTGDPKVSDGGNIVSGDEIIFDIEKNRVEVKGGLSGRGKAKIQPGEEIEKLK
jgi:outer membrane protein assembly factor BamD